MLAVALAVVFGVAPVGLLLLPRALTRHEGALVHGDEALAAAPARRARPLEEVMGVLSLLLWIQLPHAHALRGKKGN